MKTSTINKNVASSYFTLENNNSVPAMDINEVRNRSEKMLRDMAFVLAMTRKVKAEILAEKADAENEGGILASAGV